MEDSFELLHNHILACTECGLCRNIHNKVPGQGNQSATLMLIGEGPGADEDAQGLAFVGKAGQLLTKMLSAIRLSREDVYICNVVKCRPPQNRTPQDSEMQACLPFLRRQFLLLRPKVLLLLGATAARAVLGPETRITRDRGKWVEKKGVYILATYHPAALLRDPAKKRDAWEDLQKVRLCLDEIETGKAPDQHCDNSFLQQTAGKDESCLA